jgi:hypothetical protein
MEDKNAGLRKAAYYFGIVMVGVYLVFGACLIFTSTLSQLIPNNRTVIGALVVSYGIFRLYMTLRLTKKRNLE